jgi:hypothetical protein
MIAVSTATGIVAWIGLAIGLVVFCVVISLLQGVLTPLRKILVDVRDARTAPMLEHGVRGPEQLDRTRQLAGSVPDAAIGYMQKLGLPVDTEYREQAYPELGGPVVIDS